MRLLQYGGLRPTAHFDQQRPLQAGIVQLPRDLVRGFEIAAGPVQVDQPPRVARVPGGFPAAAHRLDLLLDPPADRPISGPLQPPPVVLGVFVQQLLGPLALAPLDVIGDQSGRQVQQIAQRRFADVAPILGQHPDQFLAPPAGSPSLDGLGRANQDRGPLAPLRGILFRVDQLQQLVQAPAAIQCIDRRPVRHDPGQSVAASRCVTLPASQFQQPVHSSRLDPMQAVGQPLGKQPVAQPLVLLLRNQAAYFFESVGFEQHDGRPLVLQQPGQQEPPLICLGLAAHQLAQAGHSALADPVLDDRRMRQQLDEQLDPLG
jgi:hypothetical protein